MISKFGLNEVFLEYLRSGHSGFIGDRYRNTLNEFLALDVPDGGAGETDKKQFFRFYANEFRNELMKEVLPPQTSSGNLGESKLFGRISTVTSIQEEITKV